MSLARRMLALFDEAEDPDEPRYDPVHLAAVIVACMAVCGVLFWLLWTLLVYEGGIAKAAALAITAAVVALLHRSDRAA